MQHKEDEPPIKSINTFWFLGSILLIGAALFSFVGCLLITDAFSLKYIQIGSLLFGSISILAAAYTFYLLWNFDTLHIYYDRLIIKSMLGYTKRTILLKDITAWAETEKEDKGKILYTLTIYTDRTSYKIYSILYANYASIRDILTSAAKRSLEKQRAIYRQNKKWSSFFLFVIAATCLYATSYFYSHKNDAITPSDLVLLMDEVSNTPEITKGAKGSRSIDIRLKKHSEFNFRLSGDSYRASSASSYVANVKLGDTVYVGILDSDYRMKIAKDTTLSFWEKSMGYNTIPVYDLSDTSRSYLDIADYNICHKESSEVPFWVFLCIGTACFFFGVQEVKEYIRHR